MRDIQTSAKQKTMHRIIGVCLVVFIIGIVVWQSPAIKRQLDEWKLLPKTAAITELYFTDTDDLPVIYLPGQPVAINFTVHNSQHTGQYYTYEVLQELGTGSSQSLKTGDFVLEDGQSINISSEVIPIEAGGRTKLVVKISPTGQNIGIWLTRGQE